MVPLKLTLRNFLCYGEAVPTLDLEGIHIACLCGQNGHGKSALLDAITWALWGKARGNSHDELVHYGRDEMMVELDFRARGVCYRVVRRHSLGGARRRPGATDLQLQVRSEATYRPITGNSVRDTQSTIDRTVGMDYDTFINSAYLVQGRADEFTDKTPGARKEVLARILGLQYYDRVQERAKELGDQKKARAALVEAEVMRIRGETATVETTKAQLNEVLFKLGALAPSVESAQAGVDALKAHVDGLVQRRQDIARLEQRVPQIE